MRVPTFAWLRFLAGVNLVACSEGEVRPPNPVDRFRGAGTIIAKRSKSSWAKSGVRLVALAGTLLATLAPGISAGQRPTISENERRIGELEQLLCAAADVDGDTYRPLACAPGCNCIAPGDFTSPASGSCQETSAGTFSLSATHIDNTPGACGIPVAPFCGHPTLGAGVCQSNGNACEDDSDCNAGQVCGAPTGPPVCLTQCSVHTDCPGSTIANLCDRPPISCVSNLDCTVSGDTCQEVVLGGGFFVCTQSCSVDADCDINLVTQIDVAISGVSAVAGVTPATCDGSAITSRDALECVAIAEAGVGNCTYLCGDGATQAGEECDDGNRTSGDGCDAACHLET